MVELTHDAVSCSNAKKLNTMCRVLEDGIWIVGCPDVIKRRSTGEYDFIKFDVSEWRELPSSEYDDAGIRECNSMQWQFKKAMREQLAVYRKLLEKSGYTVGSGTIKNIRINQSYTETK